VRTDEFKLIRNLTPDDPVTVTYSPLRAKPMGRCMDHVRSWLPLAESDPTVAARLAWFEKRPPDELYNIRSDPYELVNLADDPDYAAALAEMRGLLDAWMADQGDRGIETRDQLRNWQSEQHRAGKGFLSRTGNDPIYPGKRN
jgi:hypothetical protein